MLNFPRRLRFAAERDVVIQVQQVEPGDDVPVGDHFDMTTRILSKKRLHSLEGIERQSVQITDLQVALLSVEYPPEEQLRVVKGIWWND